MPDEVQQASSEPIGMADYRGALLAVIEPLPPIGLNVLDALGRRLCEDIVSDIDLPTFTSAAVAGYAVRAVDVASASPSAPARLPVLDTLDSPVYRGAPLLEGTAKAWHAGILDGEHLAVIQRFLRDLPAATGDDCDRAVRRFFATLEATRSGRPAPSREELAPATLSPSPLEPSSLRADLAFYQRLMGGKAPRQGLTVQQIALRPIGDGDGYELRATLTQNLRKGETTSGDANIRVEGMLKGSLKSLDWRELAQRKPDQPPAFSFKYFQELDASFVLPDGFTPNRVVLVMKSAQGDQFERSFPWEQALATGADEHVWK